MKNKNKLIKEALRLNKKGTMKINLTFINKFFDDLLKEEIDKDCKKYGKIWKKNGK